MGTKMTKGYMRTSHEVKLKDVYLTFLCWVLNKRLNLVFLNPRFQKETDEKYAKWGCAGNLGEDD